MDENTCTAMLNHAIQNDRKSIITGIDYRTDYDKILLHLIKFGSISVLEAFASYNMTKFSARISELSRKIKIISEWEKSKQGKRYKRYYIDWSFYHEKRTSKDAE